MNTADREYLPISRKHIAGIIRLCEAEGWPSYTEDETITWKALTAPGCITFVAVDNGAVVGFAQLQTDGTVQAHLTTIAVDREHRRGGIGRGLIEEVFARSGAKRIDLVCEGPQAFYESFAHRRFSGFRIYPQYERHPATGEPR
jgi:ribosomal protein S18 acetylase RimI-like enzyme